MESLKSIKEFLFDSLKDKVKSREFLEKWLDSLANGSSGEDLRISAVFLINLYIDIKNNYIEAAAVVDIIDNITGMVGNHRKNFLSYVKENQGKFICNNGEGECPPLTDDRYIRVLDLDDLMQYYLAPVYGFSNAPVDIAIAKQMFFTPLKGKKKDLIDLGDEVWRGALDNVWVTSQNELNGDLEEKNKEPSHVVCRALGLECRKGATLVYVKYPSALNSLKCCKPTILDAGFGHSNFLSIKTDDKWGMTCPCHSKTSPPSNPDCSGRKERIHEALKNVKGLEAFLIGETKERCNVDYDLLLDEARKRRDRC